MARAPSAASSSSTPRTPTISSPGETWAASVTGRYESNGKGWTTSATGAYRFNENWDVLGNIVYRDYDDYKDGGGDTVNGTGFDVLSGLLKTTIRPTENSELKLGWVGSSDGWTETSGGMPVNDVDLKSNTFTARYNITDEDKSWLDLHINASYNKTNLDLTTLVPQNRFDPVTGLPVVLPAGSHIDLRCRHHRHRHLEHVALRDRRHRARTDLWRRLGGRRCRDRRHGRRRQFLHAVGQAQRLRRLYPGQAHLGLARSHRRRCVTTATASKDDGNETSGDRLSPRITVGVSPFESAGLAGLQFYGTYAEGYRSPSLTETLISGNHPAGVTFPFLPNPNLRPETGKTDEFGVNYKQNDILEAGDALRLKAAYFNNDVDDYIDGVTLSAFDPTSGCPFGPGIPICFQYQNFAKAKINGFELESVYDAGWGYAGLSASIINGHTISYEGERADLATIPSSQVTGAARLPLPRGQADRRRRGAVQRQAEGQPDRQGLHAGQCLRQLPGDRQFEGRFPRRQSVRRQIRQPAERQRRPSRHSTSPASR